MERLVQAEKEDTRLTQQELELVLNRWREEKENTVSVADVAEALHCSKAEIEALVWRARAESVPTKNGAKRREFSIPSVMLFVLAASLFFLLLASVSYGNAKSDYQVIFAVSLFAWTIYASVYVISDFLKKR